MIGSTANMRKLLRRGEDYLRYLDSIQVQKESDFLNNLGLQWQVERGLQLAAQVSIDMADDLLIHLTRAGSTRGFGTGS